MPLSYLFLTPQLPYPPRQGAALRNWGLIRELAREHQVHLLTFGATPASPPPGLTSLTVVPPPARTRPQRLRDLLTSVEPDMARRLASPRFAGALAQRLATHRFDVVQVEAIEMLPYALPYLGHPDGPLWLYDAHNAEAALQRSAMLADLRQPRRWHAALWSALQTWKLRRYEAAHLPRFDLVIAVSEADARLLAGATGVAPLVLPNGIDTDDLAPGRADADPALRERPGPALVFTGKMDFRPNVDGLLWFVDEILPLVRHDPPPTLWAVGQSIHPALDRLRDHPQVVLTGWVDAIDPFLAGADVVVVPLRMGSGTRLKVLQALSLARPLVGTALGCTGLALADGEHLRLADEPRTFAAAIDDLLQHPAAAEAMGRRGRAHVRAHFDWRVLVPRLQAAVQDKLAFRQ